jgi:cupin 2 domain-containing protein
MNLNSASIFADIPKQLSEELCQNLFSKPNVRIERIISKGQHSPKDFWYDQNQDEWILLVQGHARLELFATGMLELVAGDYLLIPAHCKHRVDWTDSLTETIWLAIYL